MKHTIKSWLPLAAMIAPLVAFTFVALFGLHWRWEWMTGYPLPILWPA
jgi:uncharacterized membrane protein YphA (DoxX/SURF4 family)